MCGHTSELRAHAVARVWGLRFRVWGCELRFWKPFLRCNVYGFAQMCSSKATTYGVQTVFSWMTYPYNLAVFNDLDGN